MTERKPPDVTFGSWVDHQIHQAQVRGELDNLEGAGKPLAELDAPYDELWWIRRKAHREGISVLPPTLQVRKDAEDVVATALRARSEREAREIIEEINARIVKILRCPPPGPILNVRPFDVEDVAARWRAAHPGRVVGRQEADRGPAPKQSRVGDWWRRRRRSRDSVG